MTDGILTGPEIDWQVEIGNIVIDPFDAKRVNPNSYNLRLSDELLVYRANLEWLRRQPSALLDLWFGATNKDLPFGAGYVEDPAVLDMAKDNPTERLRIPPEGLVLVPGVLYLGSTMEYTETPEHLVPFVEGRSSVGRLGLCVHVTAGYGESGFKGTWTLEMLTTMPLRVYAGVDVCQIVYATTTGRRSAYQGKYQGQRGPQASRLWKDFPLT
jgi:dCTP deaminase